MRTQTKTKTEAVTTTKLLVATLVALAAGGAAFAMLPANNLNLKQPAQNNSIPLNSTTAKRNFCTNDDQCNTNFCYENKCEAASIKEYLNNGPQTQPGTWFSRNYQNNFGDYPNQGTSEEKLHYLAHWIDEHIINSDYNHGISLTEIEKGSHTADELLGKKAHASGCTDTGLMFVALARAKGFPTVYVDTYKLDYLNSLLHSAVRPNLIEGHVFVNVYYNQAWHIFDPVAQSLATNTYNPENACREDSRVIGDEGCYVRDGAFSYVVVKKGKDLWDMGFQNRGEVNSAIEHCFLNAGAKNSMDNDCNKFIPTMIEGILPAYNQ